MNKFINFAAGFLLASVTTASADDLPKLTIYTYDSFVSDWGPGPAIKKAFEKTCNCELNLVGAGDGAALLSRLQLEGIAHASRYCPRVRYKLNSKSCIYWTICKS